MKAGAQVRHRNDFLLLIWPPSSCSVCSHCVAGIDKDHYCDSIARDVAEVKSWVPKGQSYDFIC